MSLKTLLAAVLGLVSFGASAGAITIYTEWGDVIWCEDQYVAMTTLINEPWMLGDGPVTLRLEEDLVLSETLKFAQIDRDITLDLGGHVLKPDEGCDWFDDELLIVGAENGNVGSENAHSFTLQDGSVTGAKPKGAILIASGHRATIKNVLFENNHCDGNQDDLWKGDVGGAIRCNGDLKLVGCTFRNNTCTTHGGAVGIYSNDSFSRYVIENCSFENNTAGEAGGALFLGCSGRISNTTINGNSVTNGQGGGVYLTRHRGNSQGSDLEGFWHGKFKGPTLMIDEGVDITGNTASPTQGAAVQESNLYLVRSDDPASNAAVMVSGDTNASTLVGLTLSNKSDVFTRTADEEGGIKLEDDYSTWFFGDADSLVSVYDAEKGLLRLKPPSLPAPPAPGEPWTVTADTAEEAKAIAEKMFASPTPPEEVAAALDEESVTEYKKMFGIDPKPKEGGLPNEWEVKFELTSEATNMIQKRMGESLPNVLSVAVAREEGKVKICAIPGLYYAMSFGPTVSLGFNSEGKLATGRSVEIEVPAIPNRSSAFFRVVASPIKIAQKLPVPEAQ